MRFQAPPDPYPTGIAGVAARLNCGPRIHPSAFVVPGATVIGDVTLEAESSVWFGAVLRGDINRIVIGAQTNLQDGVIIHLSDDYPAIIGERVTVGHGAIVHACTVDDEVLIGMGAIILDGTEIGARSIVGANALVTGGMQIPAGSLVVGSPARVIRQLDLHEQARIKTWARKYVENAKIFRQYHATNAD
ncbi:MAG TPA: gamma carbonic anhydrase family protein [Chthoniobacterales bacterium]|nr:gamma carbonic anhydrase family protein [Chthoniobacterales bacterium]